MTNGSPDLVNGLYPAWTNGLVNFLGDKWSAVFNRNKLCEAPATDSLSPIGPIGGEGWGEGAGLGK